MMDTPEPPDLGKLAVREIPRPKPKRVYKTVSVAPSPDGWSVLLDQKPIKTPMRKALVAPSENLARAIAAEWDAQKEHVDPESMPLMRLLSTGLDVVSPQRGMIIDELMKYADTDLLCYRAAHPANLRKRQETIWQPILDWLSGHHGAALIVVHGIVPVDQPAEALGALRRALESLSDLKLTAFQASAAITSSLALSLAFVHGRMTAPEVFAASQLDETFQIEMWGEDDLAKERRTRIAAEVDGIGQFLALVAEC